MDGQGQLNRAGGVDRRHPAAVIYLVVGGIATHHKPYGCFGVSYSASFWNGSHTVSKPTNPFSLGGIWRVVRKRA